jgi:hypothetical protein
MSPFMRSRKHKVTGVPILGKINSRSEAATRQLLP